VGVARSASAIRDARLDVATVTHRAFGFATPDEAVAGRERLVQTIDVAAEIGAQSIIMTTGGRGALTWRDAAARFADAVAPCAELARERGIPLAIEQTSHLYADASIAHRLSDSLRITRQAGIAIIIDLFACWFDADIDEAIVAAAPETALVQVSDYIYGDRGLPCRAVPGDGAIPLDRLIPAIVHAGFQGYFDLEIIGPRIQAEGVEQGLHRAADYMGRVLQEAGLPGT
jgi:sugar phosphate isomerase/epimerase